MSPARELGYVAGLICACALLAACSNPREPITIDKGDPVLPPRVVLEQGVFLGAFERSLHNRPFFSFKGIRYAQPPEGQLRFMPPVAVIKSNEVFDATKEGPECIQKNYLLPVPAVSGKEDCLYLNVYTPKIGGKEKLPVMVYIHGGGWFAGSGTSYVLGPQHLLDKDVVLVTFNYRLGALGFLSTGEKNSTGNYGMKDQVQVLRWVRDNIHAFGGDSQLVTIFGQSAGAVSAHYHMLSPMSKGLFKNVISQSGTVLSPWAWPANALSVAVSQAQFVNCTTRTSVEMTECLRNISAHTLVESGDCFHKWSIDPLTTFTPVLEPEGPQAFLTEDPRKMIQEGKFARVPWMVGVVAQEGIIRGVPIVSNAELLASLNSNFTELGPFLFEFSKSVSDEDTSNRLLANLTRFYLNNSLPLKPDNALGFIDIYSDRGFVHGTHKSTLQQAAQGHDNIFIYHFNYRTALPVSYQYAFAPNNNKSYGVSHCDDLLYLFNSPVLFQGWPSHPGDLQVVEALVTLWTNFARYGDPTPTNASSPRLSCPVSEEGCDLDRLKWIPMPTNGSATETVYLYIRNSTAGDDDTLVFSMETGLFRDRMAFWDNAPLLENSYLPPPAPRRRLT